MEGKEVVMMAVTVVVLVALRAVTVVVLVALRAEAVWKGVREEAKLVEAERVMVTRVAGEVVSVGPQGYIRCFRLV